jgi:hypothetical protein
MIIRDRIIGLRRVKAACLKPHPQNWRVHTATQRAAMQGILGEIGIAAALIARECEDGSLELIDGHLRAETLPDELVPVLVLDVDEAEAKKLLAALDPLAALAETNHATLKQLLTEVQTDSPAIQEMFFDLQHQQEVQSKEAKPQAEPKLPTAWQILVDCGDESTQRALYERLRGEGYELKVITM